jgi:hypothetical protein
MCGRGDLFNGGVTGEKPNARSAMFRPSPFPLDESERSEGTAEVTRMPPDG